jgi:ATP-dependent DNA helicase PIF1
MVEDLCLASLDLPGMPSHLLQLKIGVPIIMLRNINQPKLCSGYAFSI